MRRTPTTLPRRFLALPTAAAVFTLRQFAVITNGLSSFQSTALLPWCFALALFEQTILLVGHTLGGSP